MNILHAKSLNLTCLGYRLLQAVVAQDRFWISVGKPMPLTLLISSYRNSML